MSNYTKSTNFTAKDSLPTGDTNKVIRGSEFDTEFNAISVAVATKSDLASPTFTGTATFADLTGTGTINFTGATVSNLGSVTTVDINGGTIDGVTIGGSSAGAGTFSSLTATTADINGGTVDGVTIGGSSAGAGTFNSLVATTADINAGTVDNTVIGGTTPAAGTFSSLTATTANIDGGSIDGAVIGGSTPAAISGTTGTFSSAVSGTTGTFSGAVTGSNLNVSNWDTAFGWGNHATQGYLTSVTFSDMDAGAITTSGETFTNSDTQIPTNAAVRNWVLTTYPTIVENNDLTANVTWATVPDAYISESSVTQHVNVVKATQSKTYTNGEVSELTLSESITSGVPIVSVTKEVPQTGLTNNNWDVATDGTNYNLENSAYATTLTPSDASANGTFTLGSGSFASEDIGKIVTGNGGTAVVTGTDGSYQIVTSFSDTSTIASGSWTLEPLKIESASAGFVLPDYATIDFPNDNVGALHYTGKNFYIGGQDPSNPSDVFLSSDGTKMYFLGNASPDSVYEYDLSTAFDVNTATYNSVSLNISSQLAGSQGITFKPDGTKMYIAGTNSGVASIFQYSLSTAWDLSTASYDSVSFSVNSEAAGVRAVSFNNNGTKMIVGNRIASAPAAFQYSLSTAYDISTASYDSVSFTPNPVIGSGWYYDIDFNASGTKLYLMEASTDTIYQYSLSTPYNIGTAIDFEATYRVTNIETNPFGLHFVFGNGNTKVYVLGSAQDRVFQYEITPNFNVNALTSTGKYFSVASQETAPSGVTLNSAGTKMYVIGYATDAIYQYSLSTAFDVTTASYDSVSLSVSSQDSVPRNLIFGDNGSKLYVVGDTSNTLYQYNLTTAYDLSTASYASKSFNVSAFDTIPYSIVFKPDGTKMYLLGGQLDIVYQFSLSTAWDISTASYDSLSFSVNAQEATPYSLAFSTDGRKMFVLGNTQRKVFQYTLSTAWNISTASYDSNSSSYDPFPYDMSGVISTVFGWHITADGTKMYVVEGGSSSTPDTIHQFEFSFGHNLELASYNDVSFSVSSQETGVQGVAFNNDGTKMYITGGGSDAVYQYSLSTAWDLSTASYDSVSLDVSSQDTQPYDLAFNDDGTFLYITGGANDTVYMYELTTGFDLSTASYYFVSYSYSAYTGIGNGITFKPDGTAWFLSDYSNARIIKFNLGTAWIINSSGFDSSTTVSGNIASPACVTFRSDGKKMFVGLLTGEVREIDLTTEWALASAIYNYRQFNRNSIGVFGLAIKPDGTKMFLAEQTGGSNIKEVNIGSSSTTNYYSDDYAVAVTNSSAQIDSTYWADLNSFTTTQVTNGGTVHYAYSIDNKTTWKITHNTNGERSIARNNSGTWEYNSNATYASTTWTSATTNTEFGALRQALSVSANQMDKTQIEAVTDANAPTLGTTFDAMIAIKVANSTDVSPTSDGISINYDAQSLNQGAVLGTDYNWDFPALNKVRITSLADQNLKVRII